ncbi:FAD/NAD(P)-binding domain-containing protein [Dendrothele bispora CBS 962.96]|uniref:FAD/NAD(P)-binding domain-containing protein n=1 Tax=Dendrothele bispora (strain CBS 962.96) TaxID=1314807 RepID=A0A4S8LXV1_DENBC|nr:FAD/NAD(P)-binding domain-containing protein [Dendrothele bispora CBS 962.96]
MGSVNSGPTNRRDDDFKEVCVVGGGPAGLAALKTILDTPEFKKGLWKPTAFETREGLGGVWLPSPPTPVSNSPSSNPTITSTYPYPPTAYPQTPLYDSLTTNLPHPVMAFPSFHFPPSTPLFPKAAAVEKYLEDYANWWNLTRFVQFGTKVEEVTRNTNLEGGQKEWTVRVRRTSATSSSLSNQEHERQEQEHQFDYIFVCNGHYQIPRFPSETLCPGIGQWLKKGKAMHSVWYRNPSSLRVPIPGATGSLATDQGNGSKEHRKLRIVVIGSGPSGNDISAELTQEERVESVFWSFSGGQEETEPEAEEGGVVSQSQSLKPKLRKRGRILSFRDVEAGKVIFTGIGGVVVEKAIDLIILATGYKISFPFFRNDEVLKEGGVMPPLLPQDERDSTEWKKDLWNSTYHVFPLARHVFPLSLSSSLSAPSLSRSTSSPLPPTIAFLGLPVRVAPFPLLEAQAVAAVRVFGSSSSQGTVQQPIWNAEKEWKGVMERYERLLSQAAQLGLHGPVQVNHHVSEEPSRIQLSIAAAWHRFEEEEQFDYRDELWEFGLDAYDSGSSIEPPVKVQPWERRMYAQKALLRKYWVHLETHAPDEAEEWVKGVGSVGGKYSHGQGGEESRREWEEMLEKMVVKAEKWEEEVGNRGGE